MYNDLTNNGHPIQHLVPAVVSATTTPAAGIDNSNIGSVLFHINIGALVNPDASDYYSIVVQISADDSSWAAITDADNIIFTIDGVKTDPETIASGIMKKLDAGGDAAALYTVEYNGLAAYVQIEMIETSSAGDATCAVGITAIRFNPSHRGATGMLPTD